LIVLDASAAAHLLLPTFTEGAWATREFARAGGFGHAPHLLDLEVTSVIRRAVRQKRLVEPIAVQVLQDLRDLAVIRYPHAPLLDRVWELRENLSPYDAAYVALAEQIDCPLLTCDASLARVRGHRARVVAYPDTIS
jgi:predicted nucleic acid-binding protein